MKYYIISGEASGDLHSSNLMKALKKEDENYDFRFWGGDLMLEQGGYIVKHYKETAFMGVVDVVKNLKEIKRNFKLCKEDLLKYKPDLLILVDYPGFNLRMAEFAKNNNIPTHYYISPKIWAWKQSRVHKIKKFIDKMFVIFPFEIDFYKKFDYKVSYVGNPLLDAISDYKKNGISENEFRNRHNLSQKPLIAILAGSRKQEIKHNLPVMLKLIDYFPDYQFVLAAAPSLDIEIYDRYISGTNIKIIYNKTYDVLRYSIAGIITSGTATLEAALFNLPQLVCYRGDNISYHIAKRVIKVKYISLVNLVENKEVIKEFIQNDMSVKNLKKELNDILNNKEYRNKMLSDYVKLHETLGGTGASERTAKEMITINNE